MRYFNRCLASHKLYLAILFLMLSGCSMLDSTRDSDEAANSAEQQAELKKIAKALVGETELQASSDTKADGSTADETRLDSEFPATAQSIEYSRQQQQVQETTPADVKGLYQQGLAAMAEKNWQYAEQLFTQVIELNPELAGSYLNQAIIAQNTQQQALAQAKINQALKVSPLNPYAHNLNGVLARERGDFSSAEQSYLQALKSLPNYADAHLNLAILSELYQGKLALAQQHYQAYLLIHQDDKQVQRWLAGLTLKLAQNSSGE